MANPHTLLFSVLAAASLCLGCNAPVSPAPVAPAPAVSLPSSAAPPAALPPAHAEVTPGSTGGHAVSFPNGGSGWAQEPGGEGKHPALLLIPEWWGLTDWIKQDVARFAARGDVALAVDLYRGKVATDPGEAHELSRGLPEDRAMDDMKSAFRWLAARPDVDPERIGIIGWCMGGGYALAFAVAEPQLRAAVVNYGKLVTAPDKIAGLHASLLGNFAGEDRGIPAEDVRTFADKLHAAHKDADIKIYDGAKHAFMNPNSKEGYSEAAATDAWTRIDAFLARTIGPVLAVPESLRPAANEVLVLKASATGTQNYECRAGDGGLPAWTLVGPEAQLTDDAGKAIGHHYAGPTWEATDGSKVVGEVKAKANAPDGRSVAWLLLKAKSTSGTGVFSRVTSIQRTDTVGGLPPETGCDAQHAGARQASPYRAVYSFFATRP